MTQANLGLADAYINRYFSFDDHGEGLLNLVLVGQLISWLNNDVTFLGEQGIFKGPQLNTS